MVVGVTDRRGLPHSSRVLLAWISLSTRSIKVSVKGGSIKVSIKVSKGPFSLLTGQRSLAL